MAVI
ncbi:hypothetical protein YPPY96_4684, partial [Yersinia pestis PY-96]|jgi:hypothetical protein